MSVRILSPAERLSKLRAMSAREIVHRVRYAATLKLERRDHASGRLARPDRLPAALTAPFRSKEWPQALIKSRREHRTVFFESVAARDAMRLLFRDVYSNEREQTRRYAAEARKQRFEFFGQTFEYPGEIDWQADPVTKRRWPSLYHADCRVHGGDVGFGDVKHVWELSRQQFLIDLGKAWFIEREPADLETLQKLVRSWIAGNPYATGVNWSCALEPAFRVFSWLWAYYLSLDDLEDEFHIEWLRAFLDHGRFIERHLELYSSPYNHLIAEATALFLLGICFPEFRDADQWRARGRDVLEGRLSQQFYADGGSVEQSPFYHHATVGFYLLAAILGRVTGHNLSPAVWTAIERGLDYSVALQQPDGKTPSIGGADDGKPIRMEHLPFWDFRPYLAIGAVLFNRADFKHAAGRFYEDALWLLGPGGRSAFDQLPSHAPSQTSTALNASGYFIMRTTWSPDADYVCIDCGEQAAGMRTDGIPNSMHGHADCLSVIASLGGRRVLVDSGLFAYNCGGSWEAHFRETAAHNTAKVDDRDQAKHIRKMAWSHSYRPSLEAWDVDGRQVRFVGSHDGYARGASGVVHRRAVWLRPESYLLICDEFTGTGEHQFTVNYQFAPGTLVSTEDDQAVFDQAVDIAWLGSQPWQGSIACGGREPDEGWIAPSLGIKQAAPRLRLTCSTATPRTTLLTVIAVRTGVQRRVTLTQPASAAGRLALVTVEGAVDCVLARDVAPANMLLADTLLSVCHATPAVVHCDTLNGVHASVDEAAIRQIAARALPTPTGKT